MADTTKPADAKLSAKDVKDAQKQGMKDAVAEKAKIANAEFDGLPGDDPVHDRFMGSDEVLGLEPFLEMGPEQIEKAIAEKGDESAGLSETQIAGIYKLERNGPNRTPYVKALRKRLGLDKDEDVPGAGGKPWTNDVTATTEL